MSPKVLFLWQWFINPSNKLILNVGFPGYFCTNAFPFLTFARFPDSTREVAKNANTAPNRLLESLGNLLAAVSVRTYHHNRGNCRVR